MTQPTKQEVRARWAVLIEHIQKVCADAKAGTIVHAQMRHDDDCPAANTGLIDDCICLPDLHIERRDFGAKE